jgi:hypothetical protein
VRMRSYMREVFCVHLTVPFNQLKSNSYKMVPSREIAVTFQGLKLKKMPRTEDAGQVRFPRKTWLPHVRQEYSR